MIIDVCNSKLDTVFLSSWYSESEAEVFLSAGANHVICIQRDKKVTDEACISFSRAFYTALFSEGKTPWESFNIAQQTLSITQNLEGQSALFILKTKSSLDTLHWWNSIIILNNRWWINDEKVKNEILLSNNIPSPVESFIGRNQDIYNILKELQKTRLITLTGEPGIGKTSVAKFIANYIKARKWEFLKNGVIFMNVINCSSTPILKHKFVNSFREGLGKTVIKISEKKDTEMLFNEVLNTISRIEVLLIIDDAEDLLRTSKDMLKLFIESLFEASSTIKVLLTSKIEIISFLGGINGVKGRVVKLKPLALISSEKLLIEKSGRNIGREEKNKLQLRQPERVHTGCKNAYNHLFEVILGGHPIAINLAANIFGANGLEVLYETLTKSNLMNTLAQGTIGKSTINTQLKFSLNVTLRLFKDKDVFLFFNLMGYFPGGIESEVIDIIWKKIKGSISTSNWREYYSFLSKASLMDRKKWKLNNEQKDIYVLVPMLKTLAEESRSIQERNKVHRIVVNYYVDILESIMVSNSTSCKGNERLMNTLWYHEMNIWDWIYRALEIKRHKQSIHTGSKDLDESQSPKNNEISFVNFDDEKSKIYEESGPLEDSDYELILESCKLEEAQKQNENEDNIIGNIIKVIRNDVLPKKKKTLKDNDVIKLINKNTKSNSVINLLDSNSNQFLDKVSNEDDLINSIQRNIDKKLK